MSGLQHPLKDDSGGRLKGWPGGTFYLPGQPPTSLFRPALPGEAVRATVLRQRGKKMWCKYCGATASTCLLEERYFNEPTVMDICSECGSGLTAPTPFAKNNKQIKGAL